MFTQKYKVGEHPDMDAPIKKTSVYTWLRKNLFSNWYNSVISFAFLYLLAVNIPPAANWLFIQADFFPNNRAECTSGGACWGVVSARWDQYMYGFYPTEHTWRPNLAGVLLIVALLPVLWDKTPFKKALLGFSALYPFVVFWLLLGGLGLEPVDSDKLGGITLTIALGVMGIGFSLPLGIALALGRRSEMPALRMLSVIYIEFIRGVPMISLLFMATVLLPLFLPSGVTVDQLLRVVFIVIIFSSAYIAEVVRGGLQAIPKGQYEACYDLGFSYWKTMTFVVLPQALKISIPGIVNTFIGLFKDTTLVIIVGMFDLLGVGRAALSDKEWIGLANEVYIFIALGFFIFCYAMARYSQYLEAKLSTTNEK